MKGISHKISAILMSAVVLFSTLSFTVDMHYCGERLVDIAFFKEARSCGMEQMRPATDCGDKIERKSCCTDEQIVLEGHNDLKDNLAELTFEQQVFLVGFAYFHNNLFPSFDTSSTYFIGHPPPLLDKDYQVLYETFLI